MPDLSTNYLGLKIRNPIVVGSSSLTSSVEGILKCEESGAGAVSLKTLFEQQIQAIAQDFETDWQPGWHTESYDLIHKYSEESTIDTYLKLIRTVKKEISIPVFASLNCVTESVWCDYARHIEQAGADAIELNLFLMPDESHFTSASIEKKYLRICEAVTRCIHIPVAVKIGMHFTSLPATLWEMSKTGIRGFILFNRFFQVDIDVHERTLIAGYRFSAPSEYQNALRWIAVLYGRMAGDFIAATGIHDGESVVKQLLAGAAGVQVCSTLFQNGFESITKMLQFLENWMSEHHFSTIDDFRGIIRDPESPRPRLLHQFQYIKAIVGID